MPASLHARITRTAISPRLAIRTFCSGLTSGLPTSSPVLVGGAGWIVRRGFMRGRLAKPADCIRPPRRPRAHRGGRSLGVLPDRRWRSKSPSGPAYLLPGRRCGGASPSAAQELGGDSLSTSARQPADLDVEDESVTRAVPSMASRPSPAVAQSRRPTPSCAPLTVNGSDENTGDRAR